MQTATETEEPAEQLARAGSKHLARSDREGRLQQAIESGQVSKCQSEQGNQSLQKAAVAGLLRDARVRYSQLAQQVHQAEEHFAAQVEALMATTGLLLDWEAESDKVSSYEDDTMSSRDERQVDDLVQPDEQEQSGPEEDGPRQFMQDKCIVYEVPDWRMRSTMSVLLKQVRPTIRPIPILDVLRSNKLLDVALLLMGLVQVRCYLAYIGPIANILAGIGVQRLLTMIDEQLAKLPAPLRYKGKDDADKFEVWLQSLLEYLSTLRLTGKGFDKDRLLLAGNSLGGDTATWYYNTDKSPTCEKMHWTFEEAIMHKKLLKTLPYQFEQALTIFKGLSPQYNTFWEIYQAVLEYEQNLRVLQSCKNSRESSGTQTTASSHGKASRDAKPGRLHGTSLRPQQQTTPNGGGKMGWSSPRPSDNRYHRAPQASASGTRPTTSNNVPCNEHCTGPVKCFACGQIGHYSSDPTCPKYGKQNTFHNGRMFVQQVVPEPPTEEEGQVQLEPAEEPPNEEADKELPSSKLPHETVVEYPESEFGGNGSQYKSDWEELPSLLFEEEIGLKGMRVAAMKEIKIDLLRAHNRMSSMGGYTTPRQRGSRTCINFGAHVTVQVSQLKTDHYFDVVDIDKYDVILDTNFCQEHNIVLNFGNTVMVNGQPIRLSDLAEYGMQRRCQENDVAKGIAQNNIPPPKADWPKVDKGKNTTPYYAPTISAK
ncbi:hypothetical protein GY45DRAFT_1341022 [Cubamyces sp. BRFM 1775]|nr:hypothetical protein GY45DRAFT_1341022 [Cubamyces sp. BRFM 1775]